MSATTNELDEFRTTCRAFLSTYPFVEVDENEPQLVLDECRRFQQALAAAGLAGLTYDTQWGGQALTAADEEIWREEAAAWALPNRPLSVSLGMCLPTINQFGTDVQKKDHLSTLISGESIWCQLFSEPNAGSDLAGVETSALADDAGWLVNGQKVWTTWAQYSDHGLLLARTDRSQPKHRGLSMFLLPMGLPGVEVRAIRQLTGRSRFNEVFLSDVHLPADALLGAPGDGWRIAVATLMFERVSVQGSATREGPHARFQRVLAEARRRGATTDPVMRQELADLYIRETLLYWCGQRARADAKAGRPPGPSGSIGKLSSVLVAEKFRDLAFRVRGGGSTAWADPGDEEWVERSLETLMLGIAGGTNEIQRNILGERVLGLPKDIAIDRDVPFSERRRR